MATGDGTIGGSVGADTGSAACNCEVVGGCVVVVGGGGCGVVGNSVVVGGCVVVGSCVGVCGCDMIGVSIW